MVEKRRAKQTGDLTIYHKFFMFKFQEKETKNALEVEKNVEDWNFERCFENEIPKKPSEIDASIVIESDTSINPISTKGALSDGFGKNLYLRLNHSV